MSELFCSVHILDAPFHADRAYTYFVPPEFRDEIQTGMLVGVPYGTANRRVPALVTEVTDQCTLENTKPVLSILGDGMTLDEEMLALCQFLKEYTLCSIGDAVRTVIPSSALARTVEYYRVCPEKEDGDKLTRMGEKAILIYTYIRARERISLSRLKTEFGPESADICTALYRSGFLHRETEVNESHNIKQKRYISLAPALRDAVALESAVKRQRSSAQASILTLLSQVDEYAESDLLALSGTSAAPLSSLLKKGLLIERLEEEYRDPFAEKITPPDVGESPLSPEQSAAFATLNGLYESGEPKAALLHGVTGSGKTRVILAAIDRVRQDGRGVIVLVPEIALTPQMVGIFLARYGEDVAVIHSSLSSGERYDAWRRIRTGEAHIVIGTRSAVFAPLADIGMIVIDEEQEHTYKSDADPKYSAHDVARFRCGRHKALMLLASATPSVHSYYKAMCGHYTLIEMKSRYGPAQLPQVRITDMRGEPGGGALSPMGTLLRQHLTENTASGRQSIVFLNRRGYNSFVLCRTCGEPILCPNCSVSLTYHVFRTPTVNPSMGDYTRSRREDGRLSCHYCGYSTHVPARCPGCGSEHFHFRGYGTQRMEEELTALDGSPRVIRMDMDTTSSKFAHEELLSRFRAGEADILLGTQMVTKGHDFPAVTLVGVVNADASLYMDDYRAAERTFAMLTQVIGRAGRADKPGTAIIQTLNPTSDIIALAARQDYGEFYRREIRMRHELLFPPFCDIAVITLQSRNESLLAASSVKMKDWLAKALSHEYSELKMIVFGPFEAPVYKVQGVYRNRVVIKCRLNRPTRAFLTRLLTEFGRNVSRSLTVSADLNPSTL